MYLRDFSLKTAASFVIIQHKVMAAGSTGCGCGAGLSWAVHEHIVMSRVRMLSIDTDESSVSEPNQYICGPLNPKQ